MKNFPRNSGQGLVGRLSRTSPVGCSSTSNEFLVPHRLSSSQAFLQSYRSLSRNQAPKSGPIFSTILAQMFLKKTRPPPKKKRTIEFVELNPPKKKKKNLWKTQLQSGHSAHCVQIKQPNKQLVQCIACVLRAFFRAENRTPSLLPKAIISEPQWSHRQWMLYQVALTDEISLVQ